MQNVTEPHAIRHFSESLGTKKDHPLNKMPLDLFTQRMNFDWNNMWNGKRMRETRETRQEPNWCWSNHRRFSAPVVHRVVASEVDFMNSTNLFVLFVMKRHISIV